MEIVGYILLSLLVVYLVGVVVCFWKFRKSGQSEFISLRELDIFFALGWPLIAVVAIIEWVKD